MQSYTVQPIHYVAYCKNTFFDARLETMKALLKIDFVDINQPREDGSLPIELCATQGCIDLVMYLIKNAKQLGVKQIVNNSVLNGMNLLQSAAYYSHYQLLKFLVQTKLFDINGKDSKNGGTALIKCSNSLTGYDRYNVKECDNFKCFQYLVSHKGVDLNAQNNRGEDARSRCVYHNKNAFVACFDEARAQ